MRCLFCALLGALLTLSGCSLLSREPDITQLALSEAYRQQPLPGRIFDGQHWISEAEALSRLQSAERIILGERHDNPDHHALQQQLVQQLGEAGWLKQLSLEMLHTGFQRDLEQLDRSQIDQVEEKLKWAERNPRWPWAFYGPIIQTALSADAGIHSANIPREQLMALYQQPGEIAWPDSTMRAPITQQLIESHCGQLAGSGLEGMLAIQSLRDLTMARSLAPEGSLLLAGAFHARLDVGVPRYLQPEGLMSVGFVELAAGTSLEELIKREAPRYDLIWITPAMVRPDPCKRNPQSRG